MALLPNYPILACVILSISGTFSQDCMSNGNKKCFPSSDPKAKIFFTYFKWTGGDPCFLSNGKRLCLTNTVTGMKESCTCTAECGCTGVAPVPPVVQVKCDSSSVSVADKCTSPPSNITSVYCPLTKINSAGITVQNSACVLCGVNAAACNNAVCSYKILTQADKDAIVKIHNTFRSRVASGNETRGVGGGQPPAADMNELTWDDNLAFMAQLWTNQCPSDHNPNSLVPEFRSAVGENIAYSWNSALNSDPSYENKIKLWYDEVANFPPKNVGSFSSAGATGVVGHYTALIWGKTKKVGCGYIMYKSTKANYPYQQTFICNYGPSGNYFGQPVYTAGTTASLCKSGVRNGLCL